MLQCAIAESCYYRKAYKTIRYAWLHLSIAALHYETLGGSDCFQKSLHVIVYYYEPVYRAGIREINNFIGRYFAIVQEIRGKTSVRCYRKSPRENCLG